MIHDDLLEHIERVVGQENLLLIDTNLFQAGRRRILRVFVDRPGRVTIGECANVSREIGNTIEALGLMPGEYTLEVSSPGLDRKLSTENDWVRCVGRKLEIKTESGEFVDVLVSYDDGLLTFEGGEIMSTGSVLTAREAI